MNISRSKLGSGVVSSFMVIVLSLLSPLAVLADGTSPDTTTTTPTTTTTDPVTDPTPTPPAVVDPTPAPAPVVPTPTTGQTQPNGAASKSYKYNPDTGLWENDFYIWDPVTKTTRPKTSQSYSYNPTTGKWDTMDWQYDAAAGKYIPNYYAVAQPPAGTPSSNIEAPAGTSNLNNENNAQYNGFYNASISNILGTQATSGNAVLYGNTTGGNVTTGNATAMSTLINLLQSQAGFANNPNLNTFNANIQGDVVGDILINPGAINGLQAVNANNIGNLTVNDQANTDINNNLNVAAASGNATISHNTNAGNATTGNANAVANVMNLLNSAIGSGQSFIGAVNIYGSLNGDILLPPGFLDTVLASNAPNAPSSLNSNSTTNIDANLTNNLGINNNITSNANTGNAVVGSNTNVGDVKTGDALSNVTVLNMTGRDIVGANDLLVFVNVLGKWVGVIMDPANMGATAANIGGGITQNNTNVVNAALNAISNTQINNDINVSAQSGDATATGNTNVGNVKTGNATTSVNLANFVNSHLSLSDWFGILFINVYGTWDGSFGLDTAAGNKPTTGGMGSGVASTGTTAPQVFKFVPSEKTSSKLALASVGNSQLPTDNTTSSNDQASVLGSTTNSNGPSVSVGQSAPQASANKWLLPLIGFIIAAVILAAERYFSLREERHKIDATIAAAI